MLPEIMAVNLLGLLASIMHFKQLFIF
uniref:Uncharacterized protein n=1 Tax=Anguilla anguilla TaxID=7936 RepID=A0A0E9RLL8_ANGAN